MKKRAHAKNYPKELREKAVQAVQVGGRSVREVAQEFGVSKLTVQRWVRQAERDAGIRKDGLTTSERQELARLRREHERLKQEIEILSAAKDWFGRDPDPKP